MIALWGAGHADVRKLHAPRRSGEHNSFLFALLTAQEQHSRACCPNRLHFEIAPQGDAGKVLGTAWPPSCNLLSHMQQKIGHSPLLRDRC